MCFIVKFNCIDLYRNFCGVMHKLRYVSVFTLLSLFCSDYVFGQGLYFKGNGGYSVAISKRRIPSYAFDFMTSGNGFNYVTNLEVKNNVVTVDDEVEDTYNKGAFLQFGFGYTLSKYIAIEADFAYLWGAWIKPDLIEINNFRYDFRTKMRSFIFAPSLVISPDVSGSWKPYAKLGGVVFLNPEIKSKVQVTDFSGTYVFRDEVKNGLAFGSSGALGVDYFLDDHFSVFAEISVFLAAYTPKKRQIKEYSLSGNDLSFLLLSTEWKLKKEISSQDAFDKFDIAYTMPLSGLGFNFGIKYSLTR